MLNEFIPVQILQKKEVFKERFRNMHLRDNPRLTRGKKLHPANIQLLHHLSLTLNSKNQLENCRPQLIFVSFIRNGLVGKKYHLCFNKISFEGKPSFLANQS